MLLSCCSHACFCFFSSRRRHTRSLRDWSSDVCSSDLQRQPAVWIHFHRHLIVRAADAARLHFETRLDVVDRLLEHLQRIVAALFLDDVEGLVNDALGSAALAVAHHAVDKLAHERALIDRVRRNISLWNFSSTRHDLSLLGALRAIFPTTLHSSLHTDGVQRPADDVIAHARQILDAAAADEHQRVLLEVVADTRNVGGDLDAIGEPHARYFAQRGIRLLRGLCEDADANAALLRAVLQGRTFGLADDFFAARANEL